MLFFHSFLRIMQEVEEFEQEGLEVAGSCVRAFKGESGGKVDCID